MDLLSQQRFHAEVELELYPEDRIDLKQIERMVENFVLNQ